MREALEVKRKAAVPAIRLVRYTFYGIYVHNEFYSKCKPGQKRQATVWVRGNVMCARRVFAACR